MLRQHFIIAVAMLTAPALAANLPEPVIPAGVGVNIHFTKGREPDLDLIAAGGFRFIRMDFSWTGTEKKKGEYDWSAYDELQAGLDKRGIRALYILDYGHPLYEEQYTVVDPKTKAERKETPAPRRPQAVAAFAKWAGAAATHFKGKRVIWEIWNEPNIFFWRPKPDVKDYTALAQATIRAVREADPQATIIAPATSEFPWAYLEEFLAAGVLKDLDAVSVHPYRGGPPETAAEDYFKLRGLIARYAPEGRKNLPIVSGEWGYSTQRGGQPLERQAAYIVRQHLSNLLNGVPLSIWYDWKNDGTDENYNEHNFGTVTPDLKPKPSYVAIQAMARQLAGFRVARRLHSPREDDYIVLCVDAKGQQKLVAWTLAEDHEAPVDVGQVPDDGLTAADLAGNAFEAPKVKDGKLPIKVSPSPMYLTLKQPSRNLAAAACWRASVTPSVLVEAGKADGLTLAIEATNPFNKPARMAFDLVSVSGDVAKPVVVNLPPNGTVNLEMKGTLTRREPEPALKLRTEFHVQSKAAPWEVLRYTNEPVRVVVTNPLSFAVGPTETGVRLQVGNPAGAAWDGSARVYDRGPYRISLAAGQKELLLDVGLGPDGGYGGGRMQLIDSNDNVVAEMPRQRLMPVVFRGLKAMLDGDAKVPATANVALAPAPLPPPPPEAPSTVPPTPARPGTPPVPLKPEQVAQIPPYKNAYKLDYDFAEGWRFVRLVPEADKRIAIEGQPVAMGVWVKGDGSGCGLRLRVTDGAGQSFQPNGPAMDWTNWRWVVIPLGSFRGAGHWGGANDGVARPPLAWDCPLLIDGHRKKAAGTVWFAGFTLIYEVKE